MKKIIKQIPSFRASLSPKTFPTTIKASSPFLLHKHQNAFSLHTTCRTYMMGTEGTRRSSASMDRLEFQSEENPDNADIQAVYLQKLNDSRQYDEVIRRYDSQQYARNKQVDYEYAQAVLAVTRHLLDSHKASNRTTYRNLSSTSSGSGSSGSSGGSGGSVNSDVSDRALNALLNNQALFAELLRSQKNEGGSGDANSGSSTGGFFKSSMNSIFRIVIISAGIYFVYKIAISFKDGSGGTHPLISGLTPAFTPIAHTGKTFDDVKGIDECKEEVMEIVQFLKSPEEFARLGGKLPRGVLLSGPPGTGKTLIAKAIAGEAGVPFFYASGAEFDGMLVGLGAKRIISLFESAKKHAPSIIFIDEIDALGGKRGVSSENYHRQTINQFLSELDGFNTQDGIIVIGATNFLEVLDPALTRPGRFDKKIHVPLPNLHGRIDILKLYLKNIPLAKDMDTQRVASRTVGFSGAELENLVNTASIRASKLKHETLTNADLDHAFDRILMGLERRNLVDAKDRYVTAVHETGHALMTVLRDQESELHKLTILPRGQALGFAASLKRKDTVSITKSEMKGKIAVLLGGVVAEELIFGKDNVTSGASNDLERATEIARSMVELYGMSNLGLGTFKANQQRDNCSPETKREIDLEVRRIINECYERTKEDLTTHNTQLKHIADSLMEYETLTGMEVQVLLKGGKLQRKPTEDIQFNA